MKSSPSASDEIKSAIFNPTVAGYHRVAISSTIGGFIPQKADLVKKDCNFVSTLQSFFGAGDRT